VTLDGILSSQPAECIRKLVEQANPAMPNGNPIAAPKS
jgi:hypothetical protein